MSNLAILKLDQIGDYVLFRNFIEIVKKSEKYKNYDIILIGNEDFKPLALKYDSEFVSKFIWVNKRKYRKCSLYRCMLHKKINAEDIDILISPTYSRDAQWVEKLVENIDAEEKIGSFGDGTNITMGQKAQANRNYTKLIRPKEEPMFEFYRNKEFFATLLEENIEIDKTYFPIDEKEKTRLVAFFIGAGAKYKKWSVENFAKVADFVKDKFNYKVCLLGNKKDKKAAEKLIKLTKADCINLCGEMKLENMPEFLKKVQFAITNDTSGFHVASAVGCKVICVSNGSFYPRFMPYPYHFAYNATILPDEVDSELNKENHDKYVRDNLLYGSIIDIDSIKPEKVINKIKEFFEGN